MRRRLYFLLPDDETAEKIENELLLARIEESHIHFLAKNEDVLIRKHLHSASLAQKSNLVCSMERGLCVGGLTGAVVGTAIFLYPFLGGTILGMGFILVLALIGALIGTWVSGMIGISIPNTRLRAFSEEIEAGHIHHQ